MSNYIYPYRNRQKLNFSVFGGNPGVDNLPKNLDINGVSVSPTFVYYGGQANGTNWTAEVGETLTAAGSGGTFNAGSPLLGANDDSVDHAGTRYYSASGSTFADITTEDFIIELVFNTGDLSATTYVVDKVIGGEGYYLLMSNTGLLQFAIDDSINSAVIESAAVDANTWYHAVCFVDKSGFGQWYVNKTASGAAEDVSSVGSITSNESFTIGGTAAGVSIFNGNIAYLAMWKRDSWLDTHLQADIAAERFARLTKTYAEKTKASPIPTTATRASHAYVDKYEDGVRKLYKVGDNWMRVVVRQDAADGYITGYLAESASTNLVDYSEDFSQGNGHLLTNASVTDGYEAPDGSLTADSLEEGGTAASPHLVRPGIIAATDGSTYTYSVWLKKGYRTWAVLQYYSASQTNVRAYFDLENGVVGTETGVDDAGIENWGDGWYRCWIKDTKIGNETLYRYIYAAEGDGDYVFDGENEISLYMWGEQLEESVDYPSSYIYVPSTSDVTRAVDALVYSVDYTKSKGSLEYELLTKNANRTVLELSDGGAAADRIYTTVDLSGFSDLETRASGGNSGTANGTTSVIDDTIHAVKATFKTDSVSILLDGTLEATDSTADIPDDLDTLTFEASDGVISEVKLK